MARFIPSLAAAPEDLPMTHLAAWSACTRSLAVRCTIWEIPDDVWPMIHTILEDQCPRQAQGASADKSAAWAERHPLSPAHRLPMESATEAVRR